MSLRFTNNYPSTLWAMIEWYHPNCEDGGNWEKAGWWKIDPGQTKTVFGGDVSDVNRYWYFFAHDADGTLRLVVSNKDRMHPGVMDGIVMDRPRPVAGMIFFNEQGD